MSFSNSAVLSLPYFLYLRLTKALLDKALNKRHKPCAVKLDHKNMLYVAASCLPFHISGYTARTHEILKSLYAADYKIKAFTRPGYPWDREDSLAEPAADSLEWDGVIYNHSRRPTRWKLAAHYAIMASRVIRKFAQENQIGRIHAASNHINALPALLAARSLGIPFQYEIRGLWELTRAARVPAYGGSPAFKMGLALEEYVAARADSVFVISRQLGLYAKKNWRIDENKIKLLPNCVNIERIKPLPGVEVEPDLIGYAGSLLSYEGLDILLRAMAILRSKNRYLRLMLIGDGEAREELMALAKKLDLQSQVSFLGRMDPEAARAKLARASLVCLPRKAFEVCKIVTPLKLVEALAMGKPVICSDLPVFKDELGGLAEGWTFEAGNPQALANIIEEKLSAPDALKRQGELSREHVIHSRQWSQFTPSLMD